MNKCPDCQHNLKFSGYIRPLYPRNVLNKKQFKFKVYYCKACGWRGL